MKWILGILLGNPLYTFIGLAFLITGATGGAYIKGRIDASANCREATLKAQIAILERDAKVQKEADAVEAQAMADLESLNNVQQMQISEYENANKNRPDRCPLSDSDIDRMRKLGG